MSRELIERLREAAAQRVASTAMIGADDLSAAADALESLDAAYGGAVEAGKALAKQAFKAEQERDALAAELKAARAQEPVAWNVVSEGRKHGLHRLEKDARSHVKRLQCHPFSAIATAPTAIPLYAHPVPACELTTSAICELWAEADDINDFGYAIERYLKGEGE